MDTRKRPRRWTAERPLAASAVFAVFTTLPAAAAQQQTAIECGPAQDLAAHAYTELRNAILQHDYSGACRLRNVFWQIEKYGGACPNVSKMATLLAEKSLGRNDICPGSSGIVTGIVTGVGAQGGTSGSSSSGSATVSSSNGGGSVTGSSGSSGSTGSTGSSGAGSSSTSTGSTDAAGSTVGR